MSKIIVVRNDQWLANGLKYIVGIAIYFLIGWGVDYGLYLPEGALTDWTIPSTYLVMVFWPFCLIWEILVFSFWIVLAIGAVVLAVMVFERNRGRRRR